MANSTNFSTESSAELQSERTRYRKQHYPLRSPMGVTSDFDYLKTSQSTGNQMGASSSGSKPPKCKRASPAVYNLGNEAEKPDSGTKPTNAAENNSGAENQNKSKSKGRKDQKRISTKTTANDSAPPTSAPPSVMWRKKRSKRVPIGAGGWGRNPVGFPSEIALDSDSREGPLTPTTTPKRKTSSSPSKDGRAGKSATPGNGNQTEASGSGPRRSKRRRGVAAVDNSGEKNQKNTPDSKSKGPKRPKRDSPKTEASGSGSRRSKRKGGNPAAGNSENEKKTPNSKTDFGMKDNSGYPALQNVSKMAPPSGPEISKKIPESKFKGLERPELNCANISTDNNSEVIKDVANKSDVTTVGKKTQAHELLTRFGLEKYTKLFDKHNIDDFVLSQITLDDLREVGINSVGDRRKIYGAIQDLK